MKTRKKTKVKDYVFNFAVEDGCDVIPLFNVSDLDKNDIVSSELQITILGDSNSTLLAIHNVADYFEYMFVEELNWKFSRSEHINPNILIAIFSD